MYICGRLCYESVCYFSRGRSWVAHGRDYQKTLLANSWQTHFLHTIERFAQNDKIGEIILVVGESEIKSLRDTWQNALDTYKIKKLSQAAKDVRIAYITGFARSVATPQLSLSTISSDLW